MRSKKGNFLKLPKPWLSHSQMSLWKRDKEKYRARYYQNEKDPDNVFSLFGRETHSLLETKKNLAHIPRFSVPELEIKVTIAGVPVLGYIDSFAPKRRSFIDFKTGIRFPDGSPRWTQLEVEKSDQLPLYSLLIQEKYGRVYPVCKLIWLETRFKPQKERIGSRVIEGEGNELELTGYYKVFRRVIEDWERENARKEVVRTAKEISADYKHWLSKK